MAHDPAAAGEWYVKHLGARYAPGRPPSREPRFLNGFQIGPMASLMIDNVNLIIFPVEYARQQWPDLWKDRAQFDSPKVRVIDHIAFSVDRLTDAIVRLRQAGVRVIDEPPDLQRSVMIEGPDRIRIELVEGHSPTAWGSDHVGKQIPEFVHGEECLFCHRTSVGVTWQQNAHARSVRPKDGMFELGNRVLKPAGCGKLAIQEKDGAWNETKFADRCAGCHATAVNSTDRTFAYTGIDCFSCHGNVNLKHSGDPSLVLLSKKRRDTPLLVTSLCAQCHLRGGESRTTNLPYTNQFVPGDNLLLDYAVDWKRADDAALNPGDRHVWRSARDVALNRSETTCLSCHSLHGNSTVPHRRVLAGPICNDCHFPGRPRKQVRRYEVHSPLCEY